MTSAQIVSVQWGLFLSVVFLLPQLVFRSMTWHRSVVTVYACMVFAAVFLPVATTRPENAVQLAPFQWVGDAFRDGYFGFQQMALNVLLFVPLGLFLVRRTRGQAVAIGFAVSLAIEATQLTLGYRIFDVDDLINNTAGTLLGWLLAALAIKVYVHRAQERLRLEARGDGLRREVLVGVGNPPQGI